jgi:hypothetical protein
MESYSAVDIIDALACRHDSGTKLVRKAAKGCRKMIVVSASRIR